MTSQAVKFAKSADIVGTSSLQMMRYINEAQGVFKDAGLSNPLEQFQGAKLGAPLLARIHFAERTLGKPENSEAQDKSFLRVVEMLGGVRDPARFADLADRAFKLQQSSGGTVDAELLRQVIATGAASPPRA